jgi:hypothetical protein
MCTSKTAGVEWGSPGEAPTSGRRNERDTRLAQFADLNGSFLGTGITLEVDDVRESRDHLRRGAAALWACGQRLTRILAPIGFRPKL